MMRALYLYPFVLFLSAGVNAQASEGSSQAKPAADPSELQDARTAAPETEAPASDGSDVRVRRAQSHFRRGVELYQDGDYDGALAEFTRAYEWVPSYRILYNLAQTHAERHDYVEALRVFGEYLDQGGKDIPAQRRQLTERERASLVERIATLRVQSNLEGAELVVNGQSHGVVPRDYSLQLNPGLNELRLSRRGYAPQVRRLTLAGGDALVAEFTLQRVSIIEDSVQPQAAAPLVREPTRSRGWFWVSVAATSLFGASAVTFGLLTADADGNLDDELRRVPADPARVDDRRSKVRTLAALTDGFAAATVVSAGALLYFAVSNDSSSSSERPAAARLSPRLVPSVGGVSVVGGF